MFVSFTHSFFVTFLDMICIQVLLTYMVSVLLLNWNLELLIMLILEKGDITAFEMLLYIVLTSIVFTFEP